MSFYEDIASIYDTINELVNYKEWANSIHSKILEHKNQVQTILDIGCGTGSMSIEMAKLGYSVIGLDLSDEMLSIAQNRIYKNHVEKNIQLINQDMTDIEIGSQVDTCICALEGLNHLQDVKKLEMCFASVYNALCDDGLFFFDMNAPYKFEHIYGNEVYYFDKEKGKLVWENHYIPSSKKVYFDMHYFKNNEDGTYQLVETYDQLKCYTLKNVLNVLNKTGFDVLEVSSDYMSTPFTKNSEKMYILAKKKAKQ